MKTKVLFTAILLMATSVVASAQFMNSGSSGSSKSSGSGLSNAGEKYTFIYGGYSSFKLDGSTYGGFVIGAESTFLTNDNNAFCGIAGGRFGYNTHTINNDTKSIFMSVDVPVNIGYQINISDADLSIIPYAGLNGLCFISAKDYWSGHSISYFDPGLTSVKFNRFLFGAQVGVKLVFKRIMAGFEYRPYFTDFATELEGLDGTSYKINYMNIIAGFAF